MSVLPGSLDYLYYNGILDHIPYEAYDSGMPAVRMNNMPPLSGFGNYAQPSYMQYASDYGNNGLSAAGAPNYTAVYGNQRDTFTRTGTSGNNEEKSFRESLISGFEKTKNTVNSTASVVKGLIGGAVMLGTLFLLIRGKKKP